jgi:hypothetical protein
MGINMTNVTVHFGFGALSPEQKRRHREKVGLRVKAILSQFWREDGMPEAVQALELESWIDVLQNCSHSEIREAWAAYQRSGPRTARGCLCKPDAGALYRIIIRARPKPTVVRNDPPERTEPRVSPEAARRIMAEAGFRPKRFGGEAPE